MAWVRRWFNWPFAPAARKRLAAVVLCGFVIPAPGEEWTRRERPWPEAGAAGQDRALAFDGAGRLWITRSGRSGGNGVFSVVPGTPLAGANLALVSSATRLDLTKAALEEGLWPVPAGENPLRASAETLLVLEDADGDGTFEKTTERPEHFDEEIDGPIGGLASDGHAGVVVACPPRLWRLEGAGKRTALVPDGLGLRLGTGDEPPLPVVRGPDAQIYFAVADTGFSVAAGGPQRAFGPREGGVFRCRADGSALECLARGLHAPSALVFEAHGRLLVTDGSAIHHVTPGFDGGWDAALADDPGLAAHRHEENAATTVAPLGQLAGHIRALVADPGGWPEPWAGGLLALTDSGVEALHVTDRGPGLTLEPRGPVATLAGGRAMALTPAGTVLILAGVEGKTTLLELAPPGAASPAPPAKLAEQSVDQLLTAPVTPAVQDAILSRPWATAAPRLAAAAVGNGPLPLRTRAIRTLGALAMDNPLLATPLRPLLTDPEPLVRTAATEALGAVRDLSSLEALISRLEDPVAEVRLAAAGALAALRRPEAADLLLRTAETASEPAQRLALAHALASCAPAARLAAVREDGSAPRRLVAVLALRRQRSELVARFLDDAADVAAEAARAIHDEEIDAAWPALAKWADSAETLPTGLLDRVLAANVALGGVPQAARLVALALRPETPVEARASILATLEAWDSPPEREPVWHRPAHIFPRPAAEALEALEPKLTALAPLCTDAARPAFDRLRLACEAGPAAAADLAAALTDEALPAGRRLFYLHRALRRGQDVTPAAEAALLSSAPPLRTEAREWLFRRKNGSSIPWLLGTLADATAAEKQAALRWIDDSRTPEGLKYLTILLRQAGISQVDPAVIPELVQATRRRLRSEGPETRDLRDVMDEYQASLRLGTQIDSLLPWRPALQDGDATAGRLLFGSHLLRCTECHALDGRGGASGPDLAGAATRLDASSLLESVVRPSARLATGGLSELRLADGSRVTAALSGEAGTDAVRLTTRTGEETVPRTAIVSAAPPASPCRPAARLLSLAELRDLLTFLRGLRAEP